MSLFTIKCLLPLHARANSNASPACHRGADRVQKWHRYSFLSHFLGTSPLSRRYSCSRKKVVRYVLRADSCSTQPCQNSRAGPMGYRSRDSGGGGGVEEEEEEE